MLQISLTVEFQPLKKKKGVCILHRKEPTTISCTAEFQTENQNK